MIQKETRKTGGSTQRRSHRKKEELHKEVKGKRPALINIWGIAGRQEMMEMRRLWQLRIPRK